MTKPRKQTYTMDLFLKNIKEVIPEFLMLLKGHFP